MLKTEKAIMKDQTWVMALRNSAIAILILVVLTAIVAIPLWYKSDMKEAQSSQSISASGTILDSRTGMEVPMPASDPEYVDTIRDSRTGMEVPMPASDPGN